MTDNEVGALTADELINNVEIEIVTVRFQVGKLSTEVAVRFYRVPGDQRIHWIQSHHIQTPSQFSPYMTSSPRADTMEEAIQRVVDGFTGFYAAAVEGGAEPDEEWLVPFEYFRP